MYSIIGANGYLGAYFIKNILEKTTEHVLAVARHVGQDYGERVKWVGCSVTDEHEVMELEQNYLRKASHNKIVYLAAYHHPDQVDQHPRLAWDTNITALSRFLNCTDNIECLFYPSTDSVYGEGTVNHRFCESDPLSPVNRYGEQKCVAEKLVTGYGYNVVRFPFLIAPSLLPDKPHFYDRIVDALGQGKPVEMFCDSYRSALNFNAAAELTLRLMVCDKEVPPILNVCGDRVLSKYEIGLMIAEKIGVSKHLVIPIEIASQTGIFNAKRAATTLMDNSLLKTTLGIREIPFTI